VIQINNNSFYLTTGVAYIKFSKTSEAALAMEEMNGRCIGNHPRPLKVLIAHSREQGSRRDSNEEERLLRLFVVVPKAMSDAELREHFNQFGDIDYVSIVKDKNTKESKGFAYVKYHRVSHTAKAFENCDRAFKPVFADPRPPKPVHADSTQSNVGSASSTTSNYEVFPYENHQLGSEGYTRLSVVASSTLNQDQLWKLFDLIPGLDYCEMKRDSKNRQVLPVIMPSKS
jgi:RNA recognition motif. (a.k.a. RRM, RBD, or RNP domain)